MKVVYQLTKNETLRQYGILAFSAYSGRACHTAPFLKDARQARRLVSYLNQTQYPIDDFCDLYLNCALLSLLKKERLRPHRRVLQMRHKHFFNNVR